MKKGFLLQIFMFFIVLNSFADYFSFLPYEIRQPDGTKIQCFVSGDEYYNWIHDGDGFTIIQAADGYFYYAVLEDGQVKPGEFKVQSIDPVEEGLRRWVREPDSEIENRRIRFQQGVTRPNKAPHTGTLNNIVIYIKFSDDTEFTNTRQFFDDKFNLVPGVSLKSYFQEVSYTQFTVSSTHYPDCPMTTNLSYTDTHPRSYFEPYNATTNPNGYATEDERRIREHTLLKDAIDWININSPVPAGLNLDGDNDGLVDNVCFNVRGGNGAWASLLWAHSWSLYSFNVYINGKQVWKYTFQPETQLEVKTICHEMFHAIGAPDLYHYSYDGLQPVKSWDLMESGFGHMGAYMKWKYANMTWIPSIPEITTTGTYTLNPLASSTNNCYKIASPNSTSQYYVVEYRKATGTFEGSLPGSGLLVYRIDPVYNGNANGPPDEVYIYRPNGTTSSNGSPNSAYYSLESGRTTINDATNPSPFLQNGTPGGLIISNVTSAGNTISFDVTINTIANPSAFSAVASASTQVDLSWVKNAGNDPVILAWNSTPSFGSPVSGTTYTAGSSIPGGGTVIYAGSSTSFSHTSLNPATTYYYKLWSVTPLNAYSYGVSQSATTLCNAATLPLTENFNSEVLPSCWNTQFTGNGSVSNWSLAQSTNAGGSPFEIKSTYQSVNPGMTRLITAPINTTGISQLNLSFKHYVDGYATGTTFRIQSSTDGINWTNEAWSLASSSGNVGPAVVNTTVMNNLNALATYISFTVEGDLYQYDYWYIDNVSITGVSSTKTVNLTLFLEGLFNGVTMNKSGNGTGNQFPGNTADQVTVELRQSTPPYSLVGSAFTVNLSTSGAATLQFPGTYSGSYYIVVKHRNSIETWSASPVSFASPVINYNFSTAATSAFGNNLKLLSGKYVIYAGDANQDGLIDSSDMVMVDNGVINFENGYIPYDINGDGLIDSSDMIYIDNNSMGFVSKITP